jgi:hypothetical protein
VKWPCDIGRDLRAHSTAQAVFLGSTKMKGVNGWIAGGEAGSSVVARRS